MSADAALLGLVTCLLGLFVLWSLERSVKAARIATLMPAARARHASRNRVRKLVLDGNQMAGICAEVAARLRAGEPVRTAWERTLSRVAGFSTDDLVGVLERSGEPGRVVLTALRFGDRTGAPLANIMERTSHALAERQRANDALEVAFSGPKASAWVLSALPLVGVVGGELLGANLLQWFTGGPFQLLLAATGIGLAVAGNLVSRALIDRAMRVGRGRQLAPVYCDLAVAALQSGMAVPATLAAIGEASDESEYVRIGRELELGATWDEAWEGAPESGALLHAALEPSWSDGVSPVLLLAGSAEQARASAVGDAKKSAEKLGVKLAFPLGLLLLPSFVILGLLPVLFSLMGGEMGSLFSQLVTTVDMPVSHRMEPRIASTGFEKSSGNPWFISV